MSRKSLKFDGFIMVKIIKGTCKSRKKREEKNTLSNKRIKTLKMI